MSGTDVLARTQDWLWDHRVPLGAVTLLAGMPGDGKGLVCMDMAARVTAGEPWPDRPAEMQRRGRVLWFESEDSVDTALIWRARAAGVSLDRIGFYNGVVDSAGKVGFSLAKHLPLLETWLEENNDARLIVFSALTTYARVEGRHGQQETRAMLERLQDLAERYSVAVVGVMHLNQVRDADARSAIKGYGDWVEVARSALLLGAEDNKRKDSPRVLAQCKSNAGERAESMRFAIEAVDVAANDTSQTSPRCAWDLDPCYVSAEELVRLIRGGHNEHGKEPSLQEQAVAVVTEELRANDGWQLSSVLEAAVSAAGLSWQNVRDARRTGKIGGLVVRKLPGQDGGWVWAASDSAFVRACEAEGGG